jgi:hypothetical protein
MDNLAITKKLLSSVKKHSPEILTGMGIAGMITVAVMAVKATPKALRLIEERKLELASENLSPTDMVKSAWKCYIPAAITGAASAACLIGATSVSARRNVLLATAYSLSESSLKEYRGKVVETFGEKKEQTVRDALAKEKIERDPVGGREVILTSKGDTLCYDVISGRYFKSDIEKLKRAVNELNRVLLSEMTVSLNELYYEFGLRETSQGGDLGWNINDGLVELRFSSQLAEDGTPCLVLDYLIPPRYDYISR